MNKWNQTYTLGKDTSLHPPLNKPLLCCSGHEIEVGTFRINGDGKFRYDVSCNLDIRFPEYWIDVEIPEMAKRNYENEIKQHTKENIEYEKQKIKNSQDKIKALEELT